MGSLSDTPYPGTVVTFASRGAAAPGSGDPPALLPTKVMAAGPGRAPPPGGPRPRAAASVQWILEVGLDAGSLPGRGWGGCGEGRRGKGAPGPAWMRLGWNREGRDPPEVASLRGGPGTVDPRRGTPGQGRAAMETLQGLSLPCVPFLGRTGTLTQAQCWLPCPTVGADPSTLWRGGGCIPWGGNPGPPRSVLVHVNWGPRFRNVPIPVPSSKR